MEVAIVDRTPTRWGKRLAVLGGALALSLLTACAPPDDPLDPGPAEEDFIAEITEPELKEMYDDFLSTWPCDNPIEYTTDIYGAVPMLGLSCQDDPDLTWHYWVFASPQGALRKLTYSAMTAASGSYTLVAGSHAFAVMPIELEDSLLAHRQFEAALDPLEASMLTDGSSNADDIDNQEFCMRAAVSTVQYHVEDVPPPDAESYEHLEGMYPGVNDAIDSVIAKRPESLFEGAEDYDMLVLHGWLSSNIEEIRSVCLDEP